MAYISTSTVSGLNASSRNYPETHWSSVRGHLPTPSTIYPGFKQPARATIAAPANLREGDYKAEEYNAQTQSYGDTPDLRIQITVEEVFDNYHSVVRHSGAPAGRFTFTAADSGDHRICFTPSRAAFGGAVVGGQILGTVKMTLDLAIGETSKIESTDKGKMDDIVQRVRDLKSKLEDIRKEQVFQRVG